MNVLMELMELGLGLSPHYFYKSFEYPGTLLRIASYPPPSGGSDGGDATAQLRYGEHTDYDGFTILQRDATAEGADEGLEIQLPSGEWVAVPSLPHTLTINVGDLFARWTNDRWRATPHRVAAARGNAAATGRARLSIVYFTGPNPETTISCLPSAKCRRTPPQYEPIKAREHVEAKMSAATAAAREGGQLI